MRRPAGDDSAPIDVYGAFDDFDSPTTDVSFGPDPESQRGRRELSVTSAASARLYCLATVTLVVVAFVVGEHAGKVNVASPQTTVPPTGPGSSSTAGDTTATSLSAAIEVGGGSGTTTIPAASTTAASIGPLYANSADLGLFAISQDDSGKATLRRIDLQSGRFSDVTSRDVPNNVQILGVAPVDGGAAPVTSTYDDGEATMARGPDATVWIMGGSDESLRSVKYRPDGGFDVVQTVPGLRSSDGVTLIGSTVDLRPVVRLADGRGYDVNAASGGLRRLTDGSPTTFETGSYAESICTDEGSCTLRIHGSERQRDVAKPHGFVQTSFSPDGRTVLVVSQDFGVSPEAVSTLIDIETGDAHPVHLLTRNYYDGNSVEWTPDSSSFFWIEQGTSSLNRLDVASRVIVRYDISDELADETLRALAGLL